jgi:hypothetical protein
MRLRIHRTDGKTGTYVQDHPGRASVLVRRFDPATVFRSGPIVIGVHNPFTVLNPDEICWIEVESDPPPRTRLPTDVDSVVRLAGREAYEAQLATQWPQWKRFRQGREGDLLEALVELSLKSGESIFLHVTGRVGSANVVDELFGGPAICASFPPGGCVYVNPVAVVRARIYHSKDRIDHPDGLWMAEADDI